MQEQVVSQCATAKTIFHNHRRQWQALKDSCVEGHLAIERFIKALLQNLFAPRSHQFQPKVSKHMRQGLCTARLQGHGSIQNQHFAVWGGALDFASPPLGKFDLIFFRPR